MNVPLTIVLFFSALNLAINRLPIHSYALINDTLVEASETPQSIQRKELREFNQRDILEMVQAFESIRKLRPNGTSLYQEIDTLSTSKEDLICRLEGALNLTLPYWDFELDRRLPNPIDSILFHADFFDRNRSLGELDDNSALNLEATNTSVRLVADAIYGTDERKTRLEVLDNLRHNNLTQFLYILLEVARISNYASDLGCGRCPPAHQWLFCDPERDYCVSKVVINGNCSTFEHVANVCHQSLCIDGKCSSQATSTNLPDILATEPSAYLPEVSKIPEVLEIQETPLRNHMSEEEVTGSRRRVRFDIPMTTGVYREVTETDERPDNRRLFLTKQETVQPDFPTVPTSNPEIEAGKVNPSDISAEALAGDLEYSKINNRNVETANEKTQHDNIPVEATAMVYTEPNNHETVWDPAGTEGIPGGTESNPDRIVDNPEETERNSDPNVQRDTSESDSVSSPITTSSSEAQRSSSDRPTSTSDTYPGENERNQDEPERNPNETDRNLIETEPNLDRTERNSSFLTGTEQNFIPVTVSSFSNARTPSSSNIDPETTVVSTPTVVSTSTVSPQPSGSPPYQQIHKHRPDSYRFHASYSEIPPVTEPTPESDSKPEPSTSLQHSSDEIVAKSAHERILHENDDSLSGITVKSEDGLTEDTVEDDQHTVEDDHVERNRHSVYEPVRQRVGIESTADPVFGSAKSHEMVERTKLFDDRIEKGEDHTVRNGNHTVKDGNHTVTSGDHTVKTASSTDTIAAIPNEEFPEKHIEDNITKVSGTSIPNVPKESDSGTVLPTAETTVSTTPDTTSKQYPTTQIQYPTTKIQYPTTKIQYTTPSTQYPTVSVALVLEGDDRSFSPTSKPSSEPVIDTSVIAEPTVYTLVEPTARSVPRPYSVTSPGTTTTTVAPTSSSIPYRGTTVPYIPRGTSQTIVPRTTSPTTVTRATSQTTVDTVESLETTLPVPQFAGSQETTVEPVFVPKPTESPIVGTTVESVEVNEEQRRVHGTIKPPIISKPAESPRNSLPPSVQPSPDRRGDRRPTINGDRARIDNGTHRMRILSNVAPRQNETLSDRKTNGSFARTSSQTPTAISRIDRIRGHIITTLNTTSFTPTTTGNTTTTSTTIPTESPTGRTRGTRRRNKRPGRRKNKTRNRDKSRKSKKDHKARKSSTIISSTAPSISTPFSSSTKEPPRSDSGVRSGSTSGPSGSSGAFGETSRTSQPSHGSSSHPRNLNEGKLDSNNGLSKGRDQNVGTARSGDHHGQMPSTASTQSSSTVYFSVTIIEGEPRRKLFLNRRVEHCEITVTGMNMPNGYTQTTHGRLEPGTSVGLVHTLDPELHAPLVEFRITVKDGMGRECSQKCLNDKGSYEACERNDVRLTSHEFIAFADPIETHESEEDVLRNQWSGRGYYRKRKKDYLLFSCPKLQ